MKCTSYLVEAPEVEVGIEASEVESETAAAGERNQQFVLGS